VIKLNLIISTRESTQIPPNVCVSVIISKIALKQDFIHIVFGRALPKHCFVGKTVIVRIMRFINFGS